MKKLIFFIALTLAAFAGSSQIKISQMPTFIGDPTGGYVPIVIAGVNWKVDAQYFGFNKLNSIFRKGGTDSLFSVVNGNNTFITIVDTTGTSIATGNTYVVASQAAMLLLSANIGDVCIIPDSSKSYILQALPPDTLHNWKLLLFPATVTSVFGRTGTVTSQNGDYNYSQISGTPTIPDTSLLKHKTDSIGPKGYATQYDLTVISAGAVDTSLLKHKADSTLSSGYATQYDLTLKQDKGTNTLQTVTNNGYITTNPLVTRSGLQVTPIGSPGITLGFNSTGGQLITYGPNGPGSLPRSISFGAKKIDSSYNVEWPGQIHQASTVFRTIPLSVNGQKADSLTGDITVTIGGSQVIDTTLQTGLLKGNGSHISAAGDADIRIAFGSQNTTYFLAGPSGTPGTPIWRAIIAADMPTLNQNTTGSAAKWTTGRTIALTGDVNYTSSSLDGTGNATGAATVVKINGTSLAGLGTGILKNTTGTGVPSIAIAADFPTLNQNTTGTAANVSGTPALPNGTTATTQATSDSSGDLATTKWAKQTFLNKTDTLLVHTDKYLKASGDTLIKENTIASIASATTHTFNLDSAAVYIVTAQAAAGTFANPTGRTPNETDQFEIVIKDNGTAQALTWGSTWSGTNEFALPSTTVAGQKMKLYFEWDALYAKMYLIKKVTY